MNVTKKPMIFGASLLLGLVALAPAAQATERSGSTGCATIRVSSPDAPSTPHRRSRKKKTSFSASEILDLQFEVQLSPSTKGEHRTELKVYTPKGHLYQTILVTPAKEASNGESGGRRRRTNEHGRRTGTAVLPVAGTTIVTSSLYGDWKVEAHVDGQPTACSRPLEFSIEP
jgi:hypothetical protein